MSVYIITDRKAGVCKIGYSLSPLKRLGMLKTSSPADLKLEAVIPGDVSCEKALHHSNAEFHIKREWFSINPSIENLIAIYPVGKRCRIRIKKPTNVAQYSDDSLALKFINRIKSLAEKQGLAPATIGARVLGGGSILASLENGKTITLAKYERANRMLADMEKGIAA